MKIVTFSVSSWGTRLKNEDERRNADLEIWVAPASYSKDGGTTYEPTTFGTNGSNITPEKGWKKIDKITKFAGSGSIEDIPFRLVAYTNRKSLGDNGLVHVAVEDECTKYAVLVVSCSFCINIGKRVVFSGSLFRDDPYTDREDYKLSRFSGSQYSNP